MRNKSYDGGDYFRRKGENHRPFNSPVEEPYASANYTTFYSISLHHTAPAQV